MKEWGATVVPKTLEAMILHNCDRLDAKVEEFNQAIVQTPQGEQWSEYHRILGTRVYVARRPEDEPLQQEET
jgi:3'-5' exoribonuclease